MLYKVLAVRDNDSRFSLQQKALINGAKHLLEANGGEMWIGGEFEFDEGVVKSPHFRERLQTVMRDMVRSAPELQKAFRLNKTGDPVSVLSVGEFSGVQFCDSQDEYDRFDPPQLDSGPLVIAKMFGNTLTLRVHHLLSDGVSILNMLRQIDVAVDCSYSKKSWENWAQDKFIRFKQVARGEAHTMPTYVHIPADPLPGYTPHGDLLPTSPYMVACEPISGTDVFAEKHLRFASSRSLKLLMNRFNKRLGDRGAKIEFKDLYLVALMRTLGIKGDIGIRVPTHGRDFSSSWSMDLRTAYMATAQYAHLETAGADLSSKELLDQLAANYQKDAAKSYSGKRPFDYSLQSPVPVQVNYLGTQKFQTGTIKQVIMPEWGHDLAPVFCINIVRKNGDLDCTLSLRQSAGVTWQESGDVNPEDGRDDMEKGLESNVNLEMRSLAFDLFCDIYDVNGPIKSKLQELFSKIESSEDKEELMQQCIFLADHGALKSYLGTASGAKISPEAVKERYTAAKNKVDKAQRRQTFNRRVAIGGISAAIIAAGLKYAGVKVPKSLKSVISGSGMVGYK